MTKEQSTQKVKQIIESYALFENRDYSISINYNSWITTPEGSRLVGELGEDWISVEDRLPDERGEYLVYGNCTGNKYPSIDIARYSEKYGFAKHNQPTHWQPLPKTP